MRLVIKRLRQPPSPAWVLSYLERPELQVHCEMSPELWAASQHCIASAVLAILRQAEERLIDFVKQLEEL